MVQQHHKVGSVHKRHTHALLLVPTLHIKVNIPIALEDELECANEGHLYSLGEGTTCDRLENYQCGCHNEFEYIIFEKQMLVICSNLSIPTKLQLLAWATWLHLNNHLLQYQEQRQIDREIGHLPLEGSIHGKYQGEDRNIRKVWQVHCENFKSRSEHNITFRLHAKQQLTKQITCPLQECDGGIRVISSTVTHIVHMQYIQQYTHIALCYMWQFMSLWW